MKRKILFLLNTAFCLLFSSSLSFIYAQDETIEFSTLYPSPYGEYTQMGLLGPAVTGINCSPPNKIPIEIPHPEAGNPVPANQTLVLMNIGVPENVGNFIIPGLLQVGGIFETMQGQELPSTIHRAAIVGKQDTGIVGIGNASTSGIGIIGIGQAIGIEGKIVDEGAENSPDNAAAINGFLNGGGTDSNIGYYGLRSGAYSASKNGSFIGGYFYGDTNAIVCDSNPNVGPAIHIRNSQGGILIDNPDGISGAVSYGIKIENGVDGVWVKTPNIAILAETTAANAEWAGRFRGHVRIERNSGNNGGNLYLTGTIHENQSDISEAYQLLNEEEITEGDIVVIGPENPGFLKKSTQPYDTRAAGIISSKEQTGMILGENDEISVGKPLALLGRVYCNVDASFSEIEPGDLLTTSPTPGYAMKAKPIGKINGYPIYPQGCIVGKALEPLKEGKGKILVLVCLM